MTCTGVKDFFPGHFMFQAPHHQEEGQDEPPPPPPPQQQQLHHRPPTSHSSMIPSCPPPDFNGVGKRWAPFSRAAEVCPEEGNGGDAEEVSDEGSPGGEKKRRLNLEQVRTLEQSFEMGNKLEPERKTQLARALGLQPRQVAIWFQNRRARWKTKKLEKDYDLLKRQLEAIEADNNALQAQNQKLRAEIVSLKSREATESINLNKDTEGSCSNRSDNSTDNLKLEISRTATTMDSPISSRNTPPGSSISFFPSSMNRPTATAANTFSQLFQNHSSARTESHLQCPKMSMDQTGVHKDESLCNMFGSMDDHPGFWPWLEQHNFN